MKKINFLVLVMIFSLSASTAFAFTAEPKSTPENLAAPAKTENKLSEEEINRLMNRVEEIRDMDKSNLTAVERSELRTELKAIKKNLKQDGGYVYIGVGTLIIIILLIILLV